ncbi:MAG: sigma-54 dependent transcriptional regulator [Chitinophagaceae bacterium]
MKKKILIVEDQFIEANSLQMILVKAGYTVCGIARSVAVALDLVDTEKPDLVLLDIYLQGPLTGIDLAKKLREKGIGFVYLSASSTQKTLDDAKVTQPYGFLVKPFREKDILVTLDIAWYLHEQNFATRNLASVANRPESYASVAEFNKIIGNSAALKNVLDMVSMVAPSGTSVLLLGESGTGKEKIADAIHGLSPRKRSPFIKVNCAAMPATLIESELFGHERGAFTGAATRRIGRFEQAEKGTIFLDEIGEMPLEIQVKLLRVLQEREIERIGGSDTIKVNVRVIAATNRNLEKEVAEGRFRMDLYYRLNVFPVTLPALRERKEDIPLLATHFMRYFSSKVGKKITEISEEAIEKLMMYDWPGNIRELENLMERAVLLTAGTILKDVQVPVGYDKKENVFSGQPGVIKTMEENERDHILAALEKTKGKVSGDGGAAELLNINASTLKSRMKKLGIIGRRQA